MRTKTVFLTGATGSMGKAALDELLERGTHRVVVLVRPSQKNKKAMSSYASEVGLKVVWGDLTRYEDVQKCVTGAQIVLHPGALVSPAADHDPISAWRTNVGAAKNLVRSIKSQPNPDNIRLVNIGTVAATGDRLPPIHVGRTGDPLKPSIFDMYACSKIAAERIVAESGLRYWVSCRQTYIATPRPPHDSIMFHQPLDTCIELCTEKDSGVLLANACDDGLPEDFWRRFYNIGGGPRCRTVYHEYLERCMLLLGIDFRKVTERDWFATRNFHGQWFEDSDILNDYLRFRSETLDDHLLQMQGEREIPKLSASKEQHELVRSRVMEPLASASADGTMDWLNNDHKSRIAAFFKSRDAWTDIPGWDDDVPEDPRKQEYVRLHHGYDENTPDSELGLEEMRSSALFRGGQCVSSNVKPGDLFTRLRWVCSVGHPFEATPNSVLKGGHWCPECAPPGWDYDEEARRNPFFAQVWCPGRPAGESNSNFA